MLLNKEERKLMLEILEEYINNHPNTDKAGVLEKIQLRIQAEMWLDNGPPRRKKK
jgi:hypothetical protein